MERLPNTVLTPFLEGKHVVRLADGYWNGIWTDMSIESTYMKNGKGPSGIIGVTTQERTVNIWANSHHLCTELTNELEELRTQKNLKEKHHKEETAGRMKSDSEDRLKIRKALATFIHPLKIETHSSNILVNIYNGEQAGDNVNVIQAVEIGEKQMKDFQASLPEGFRSTLSTQVVTMATGKKNKKKSTELKPCNTELIMSRVLYLISNDQLDFKDIFNYELAPVPTSMFEDSGEARYAKNKSDLMSKFVS